MKIQIAIFAVCASTFALSHIAPAQAAQAGATRAIPVAGKVTDNNNPLPQNRAKVGGNPNDGSKTKAGVVARYSGAGDSNYYLGKKQKQGSGGKSNLRFEPVGSSLKKK